MMLVSGNAKNDCGSNQASARFSMMRQNVINAPVKSPVQKPDFMLRSPAIKLLCTFAAETRRYFTWIATTIAHVAMTVTVAITVKSGIALDFADFAIAIP
jgi:hydrogenase/urease accessory protein HupE